MSAKEERSLVEKIISNLRDLRDHLGECLEKLDEEPELKPCPFCGGKAKVGQIAYVDGIAWDVTCEEVHCKMRPVGSIYGPREDAVAWWNRRHEC